VQVRIVYKAMTEFLQERVLTIIQFRRRGKRAQIADATSFIPQSDMTVVSGHQQNAERI
jgi:hypothetical protein